MKKWQKLLHSVNAVWHQLSPVTTCDDACHTATPSIWFQQTVSLNLSAAIAHRLTMPESS
jgi:hypothetical protein